MVRALTSVLLLGMFPSGEMQAPVQYALPDIGIVSIGTPAPVLDFTPPSVSASGALLIDLLSGEQVYGKNATDRRPMASLTKMMTALLIVEDHDLDELVRVPKQGAEQIGSTLGLKEGQAFTVRDLLYGLLLPSANDVAFTLAIHHSGTVDAFVEAMNERAQALGMRDTRFANPAGYDDPTQHSTPRDLAWLAAAVLRKPALRTVVTTPQAVIYSRDSVRFELTNTNELLRSFSNVGGVKTGTTPAAGQCLVTYFEEGGRPYLLVLLGSSARYTDTIRLLRAVRDGYPADGMPPIQPVAIRSMRTHERLLLSMQRTSVSSGLFPQAAALESSSSF